MPSFRAKDDSFFDQMIRLQPVQHERLVVIGYLAALRRDAARNRLEQRALARAIGADERDDFALSDLDIDIPYGVEVRLFSPRS